MFVMMSPYHRDVLYLRLNIYLCCFSVCMHPLVWHFLFKIILIWVFTCWVSISFVFIFYCWLILVWFITVVAAFRRCAKVRELTDRQTVQPNGLDSKIRIIHICVCVFTVHGRTISRFMMICTAGAGCWASFVLIF